MLQNKKLEKFLSELVQNGPNDWLKLTTHRLDIYHEELAKTEFLEQLDGLYEKNDASTSTLSKLPTAYDYIRLGHPLSSVLEWAIAKDLNFDPAALISFSSNSMPLLAVLRENRMRGKKTIVWLDGDLPENIKPEQLFEVYGYQVEFKHWDREKPSGLDGETSSVFYTSKDLTSGFLDWPKADFYISFKKGFGSLVLVNDKDSEAYIKAIQHVRRRESIAMTPADSLKVIKQLLGIYENPLKSSASDDLDDLRATIQNITATSSPALVASSGLSIQYAIMMGLIDNAFDKYPGQEIKIVVPPNCYGGTNDQARRVAASLDKVSIMDLPVDGDNDMVQSTEMVLQACADIDAVPLIIAEIPTNPRVEVPNLKDLGATLAKDRVTNNGKSAVKPVFILDQTFCPNVQFLHEEGILASIPALSYVSGSKFPSGGKCTAGYCVANEKARALMSSVEEHLTLCDNKATPLQLQILKQQMPSMLDRIQKAYQNTRQFVDFIEQHLPAAKINFVSKELANEGFTPSVFSLDLPTQGNNPEEREHYKRKLNQRLIDSMIKQIPEESKYCVSYGQLKGCYWTIPATSTQGTTKEEDKDYIARVSLSPDLDLEKHKAVFREFVASL